MGVRRGGGRVSEGEVGGCQRERDGRVSEGERWEGVRGGEVGGCQIEEERWEGVRGRQVGGCHKERWGECDWEEEHLHL